MLNTEPTLSASGPTGLFRGAKWENSAISKWGLSAVNILKTGALAYFRGLKG